MKENAKTIDQNILRRHTSEPKTQVVQCFADAWNVLRMANDHLDICDVIEQLSDFYGVVDWLVDRM